MGQLGDMLYDARREAGISLAEISTVTRIRLSVLEALEEGKYDSLPDAGYLRGFVSDYARYVGADPAAFLEQLEVETGKSRVTRPTRSRPQGKREHHPEVSTRHRPHDVQWKPLLIGFAVIAAIVAAVWIGYSLWPKDGAVTPTPTGPGSENTTSTPTPAAGAPFTVEVIAKQNGASDVYLTVDGLVAFDQTLTSADEPLVYDVVQKAEISVSNPDKVEVYINGTAVPITEADTTVTLTAPAEE